MKKHEIDVKDKKLGRVATEIAVLLMGKNEVDFSRNKIPELEVIVSNVSLLNISKKKSEKKLYQSYSGYPGGLKKVTMDKVIADKGHEEVLKKAVFGMLPKNRLRSRMIKNLKIKN